MRRTPRSRRAASRGPACRRRAPSRSCSPPSRPTRADSARAATRLLTQRRGARRQRPGVAERRRRGLAAEDQNARRARTDHRSIAALERGRIGRDLRPAHGRPVEEVGLLARYLACRANALEHPERGAVPRHHAPVAIGGRVADGRHLLPDADRRGLAAAVDAVAGDGAVVLRVAGETKVTGRAAPAAVDVGLVAVFLLVGAARRSAAGASSRWFVAAAPSPSAARPPTSPCSLLRPTRCRSRARPGPRWRCIRTCQTARRRSRSARARPRVENTPSVARERGRQRCRDRRVVRVSAASPRHNGIVARP